MHWIDPQSLPPIKGTVAQFVMNRVGELDGLVLSAESGAPQLVHFPPHLAGDVEAAVKAGDQVAVHGVRPRGADVVVAVSLVTSGAIRSSTTARTRRMRRANRRPMARCLSTRM